MQLRQSASIACNAVGLMRTLLVLSVIAITLGLAGPGYAAPPKCDGRLATIVGTDGNDVIRGTAGPDVIVAGAGHDDVNPGGRGTTWSAGVPARTTFEPVLGA